MKDVIRFNAERVPILSISSDNFYRMAAAMSTNYGNEYKEHLTDLYSPAQLRNFSCILEETHLALLNISLWKIALPWKVPQRRINDTLIWIVKEGEFACTIEKQTKTLTAGEGIIIPENTNHAFCFAGACSKGEAIVIHLHVQTLFDTTFLAEFPSPFFRMKYPEAAIASLLRAIALRNFNKKTAFSYAKHLILDLLLENAESTTLHLQKTKKCDIRIHKAIQYIYRNFAGDIGILDIAAAVNLHEVQFRRLFHEYTGMAPHAYLQRVRLQYAAEMLVNSFSSLSTVIQKTGFHSESYFCLVFRKRYGVSPHLYRQNCQEL